jgi:outer membrane protein, heavy metal efflux system
MKAFFQLTILWSAIAATILAQGQSPAATNTVVLTPEYLGQLSELMRTNHPALRAADARTEAASANVLTVRTWEDPMASLGGMAAREMMRAEDGDLIYGVEQKLPLFGKPKLARRVAAAEAATEAANAEYQFQQLRADFARVAFRTALAHQVLVIGEQDLAWLEVMTQTTRSKYGAGQATLIEVLQLENEQSKRTTTLQTDRAQLEHDHVTLNRLLNRDLQSPWPALELPPLAGPIVFNQRLLDFALNYEPKIQTMRQQIKQAEATLDLTRRQRLPDVSVGLEARNYTGDGSFRQGMLVFSMNLPWANSGKYRNDIKREQSKLQATELDLTDYQSGLRQEVHELTVKIDAARREALLYRDQILPRNQSAMESVRADWEANRSSVRDLLEARRMLLDARIMYVRAVAEQYVMMSDLVLCCGLGDLGALQMIGAEPDTRTVEPLK